MNEVHNLFWDKELDTFEIGTKVIVFFNNEASEITSISSKIIVISAV